ncbi:MAG: succinylglutamate-semialdehyde dehydrogenase [Gammaproteobacteria bacterium]|nr:succinylglutamate-semialdehyde dehydrogenase [Gammaproteobacteria bacterium]
MSHPIHDSLFIGGQWHAGHGHPFASRNPADGGLLWQGGSADTTDVDRALRAAHAAFDDWSAQPFAEREAICRAFAKQLQERSEAVSRTIAQETGKPLWEARTEVTSMIAKVDISVKAYHERTGVRENTSGVLTQALRHKPHGVLAVFGPYNFPGHLPNGHLVPALLAGNCAVFKPSELTPAVAEITVRAWQEAGLPAGVLNLLQGERDTGAALAAHPGLDGLLFTGSARTGHLLARQFAETPHKILALEMGGNNPLILRPVADRRAALHDVIQSAFLSSGQRCTGARRLFVPADAWGAEFVDALTAVAGTLRVGPWNAEPQPFMGPLISPAAAEAMLAAQRKLLETGGKSLLELRRLPAGAAFVSPGLIDMTAAANPPDEEFFGPLLQVYRYDDFDQAIAGANRTRYGLSASLISDSRADYERFWRRIRAGIVNWNRPTNGASSGAPFGGVGASGNHRPSAWYAADYCAFPVASVETERCRLPENLPPGLML